MVSLKIPVATYRIQFNKGFRFVDAQSVVPYLHRLGITDFYASPIFKARQGSSHGYDVTDSTHLNPELGAEQEFESLVQQLHAYGMGLLLDVVPNHMAANPENPWWLDVLENGRCSPYAGFFDIDWNPPNHSLIDKILIPILGSHYKQALKEGEFVLTLDESSIFIDYHGYRLPLNIKSYITIVSYRFDKLEASLGATNPAFQQLKSLINAAECLPSCDRCSTEEVHKRHNEQKQIKNDFWHLVNTYPDIKSCLSENIALFNGNKRDPSSFVLLDSLLSQQSYKPAFWRTAINDINYRRFFDINDLVGVRVEERRVFEKTHAFTLRLVRQKKISGLRIDHIDGLLDPLKYLRRLQHHIARGAVNSDRQSSFYVVVEKILSKHENIPEEWPVFGTTGYDFLNALNALFVDGKGIQKMRAVYSRFTGLKSAYEDVVYQSKKQVIEEMFVSEIHKLGQYLICLARRDWCENYLTEKKLTEVLIEVIACLPVYRTYTRTLKVTPRDRRYINHTIKEVQQRNPTINNFALEFVKHVLMLEFPTGLSLDQKKEWLNFIVRWQQCTGAIMAKGVEDTAFYNYNFFIPLSEVGGNPGDVVLAADTFHQHNLSTRDHWPYTLNTTSTHDTKRGEDIRARLNVLSEIPEVWKIHLSRWAQWNHEKKFCIEGRLIPDPNTEIFIYQTLLGAWPLSDREVLEFKERFKSYMLKAVREAKVYTCWLSPNKIYEDALIAFVDSILEESLKNIFIKDLLGFQQQVAYYGALNSLAQVLLKITSPGVPDFYQGTELWDLSLVDPDNRRPVNFEERTSILEKLMEQQSGKQNSLIDEILGSWQNGQIKLYVIYKALNARRAYREIFIEGEYIPLKVQGRKKEHVFAFARHWENNWVLVAVPRLLTRLVPLGILPLGRNVWKDDVLVLPEPIMENWYNIFTGENIGLTSTAGEMPLADILRRFPIALLVASSTGEDFNQTLDS